MKTNALLALSVLINLGLAVAYLTKGPAQPTGSPAARPESGGPPAAAPAVVGSTQAVAKPVTSPTKFDWRAVESADYRQYINNLRTIGCPEETIRDIIAADVNKLFQSRQKTLFASTTNRFQFWKTGNPLADMFDEEKVTKSTDLAAEKRALLKELLGADYAEKAEATGGFNPYDVLFEFLPPGKREELMEFEAKFAARSMNLLKDAQRGDVSALRKLQLEKDAELARLLGPQEKEEYDLRLSQTAMMMRMQMGNFEPTEQEFRDIFRLRKQFDDEFSPMGMGSSANKQEAERRTAAEKELNTQIRQTLGDARYLEYRYDQDFSRSSLKRVSEQYNVPRQSALRVFEIRDAAQQEARAIRGNNSLSAEQRQAALDAVRAQTERGIGQVIGQAAADAYVKEGSWVRGLNRPAGSANP